MMKRRITFHNNIEADERFMLAANGLSDLNPIDVEILFVAGFRQAQTDNGKKIETKAGL